MSDADLVEAPRRRDDSTFGELVERYQPSVFRAVLGGAVVSVHSRLVGHLAAIYGICARRPRPAPSTPRSRGERLMRVQPLTASREPASGVEEQQPMSHITRTGMFLAVALAFALPAQNGQYSEGRPTGGPFTRNTILDAPFSAEAITTLRAPFPDGSVHEYTVKARYYRDSRGRVRAEIDTEWGPYIIFSGPDPSAPGRTTFHRLDPATRTYSDNVPGSLVVERVFNGDGTMALPVGKECFQFPPPVVPRDGSDSERLRAVNAQLSPDLGIVIASHRSDAIGTIDYRVINIRREEPPGDLFDVPFDYTRMASDRWTVSMVPWQMPPACKPLPAPRQPR